MKRQHKVPLILMAFILAIATLTAFSVPAFAEMNNAPMNNIHNSEEGVTADNNHNVKEVKLDVFYDGTKVRVDHPYANSVVQIDKIKGDRNVINKWTTLTVEWSIASNNSYKFDILSRSGAWDINQYTTKESGVPEEFFTVIFTSCTYTEKKAILKLDYYILIDEKSDGNNNNDNTENSEEEIYNGWEKKDNNWYLYVNGTKIKNAWYYYDNYSSWFRFDEEGKMLYNQWVDGKYYLLANGRMALGWHKINNNWYFFNTEDTRDGYGTKIIGWFLYNQEFYYFDANGIMVTGYRIIDGHLYHFFDDGRCEAVG